MNPLLYGAIAVIIFLSGMVGLSRYELSEARNEIINYEKKLGVCKNNNEDLTNAIEDQNAIIEAQRIKIDTFVPVTVTEVVTKYVPKYINVERSDCNDTHNYLDYLGSIKL